MVLHHTCTACGGLVRPSPANSTGRFACVECDTPLILPAPRHSRRPFMLDFAGAVERGLRGTLKSARVA